MNISRQSFSVEWLNGWVIRVFEWLLFNLQRQAWHQSDPLPRTSLNPNSEFRPPCLFSPPPHWSNYAPCTPLQNLYTYLFSRCLLLHLVKSWVLFIPFFLRQWMDSKCCKEWCRAMTAFTCVPRVWAELPTLDSQEMVNDAGHDSARKMTSIGSVRG